MADQAIHFDAGIEMIIVIVNVLGIMTLAARPLCGDFNASGANPVPQIIQQVYAGMHHLSGPFNSTRLPGCLSGENPQYQ
jgi:hypothetical protein